MDVLFSFLDEGHVVVFGFLGVEDYVVIHDLVEDFGESFLDLFFLGLSGSFIRGKEEFFGSGEDLIGGLFGEEKNFVLDTLLKIENILFGEADSVFNLGLDL
jgi:hypothetical protein